jgi:hypothetical protein
MDYLQAKSETYGAFYNALVSLATPIMGYIPEVRWSGIEVASKPQVDKYYITASFQELESEQRAFTQCEPSSPSGKLFISLGLATFTIHGPSFQANAKEKSEELAKALRKQLRLPRPDSDLWLRNPKIGDTYQMDNFLRTVITVEFHYTEVE